MLDPNFLKILVCPETHQTLQLADERLIDALNERVGRGDLSNQAGTQLERRLDGGLVREDGTILYPIVDGIPTLLSDEAIDLAAIARGNSDV